ncbi:hypothetical protein [Paenibacillus alkalitolerans]|uniref:hypothetical protein n=1 Tax=Paenibacillus alkalitolerans TaxID=2799335 RepID=UPI0018F57661|nr:hypothetical protein [Paenibacillus alkalitolerans]
MGKKWFLVLSCVLLAIGLMAGCSGGQPAEDTMLEDPAAGGEPAVESPDAGTEGGAEGSTETETAPEGESTESTETTSP